MSTTLWSLAGVEARAFAPGRRQRYVNQCVVRALMLLALISYERRTDLSGDAVCLLHPRRFRQLATGTVIGLLACLIAGASPVAAIAGVILLVSAVGPKTVRSGLASVRRPSSHRHVPKGSYVYVHSVASVRPGAGAELLESLAREADSKGWSLLLDADNERLVSYYGRFGFVRGDGDMAEKAGPVRMWRSPLSGKVSE